MKTYAARVDRESGRAQSLVEHAENVATLCARFAAPLHLEQTARLIALVHDMGKGTAPFQAYLTGGAPEEAHPHARRAQFLPTSAGFPEARPASAPRRSSPCAYMATMPG